MDKGRAEESGSNSEEGWSLHLVGYTLSKGLHPLSCGRSTKTLLEWGDPTLLSLMRMAAVQMAKAEVGAAPSKQDHVLLG